MLLAQGIEVVSRLCWLFEKANFEGDPPKPEPVYRPGIRRPEKPPVDPLLQEWMRRQINGEDTSDLGLVFKNVTPLHARRGPTTE